MYDCVLAFGCRSLTTLPLTQDDATFNGDDSACRRDPQRLYVQDGMIPNYTGYVPRTYSYFSAVSSIVLINKQNSRALHAPLPAPLAQWTRLVATPAVVYRTRRNQYDAAGALACARRRSDVTRCNGIDVPPYGPLPYAQT